MPYDNQGAGTPSLEGRVRKLEDALAALTRVIQVDPMGTRCTIEAQHVTIRAWDLNLKEAKSLK